MQGMHNCIKSITNNLKISIDDCYKEFYKFTYNNSLNLYKQLINNSERTSTRRNIERFVKTSLR